MLIRVENWAKRGAVVLPALVKGNWPEWRWRRRTIPLLVPPLDLNDKLKYRMMFDRRPLLTQTADKVDARRFIEDRVGVGPLPQLIAVFDDPSEFRLSDLPRECVIKANHASGAILIISSRGDRKSEVPCRLESVGLKRLALHPDQLPSEGYLRQMMKRWLQIRTGRGPWSYEWAYRNIRPRIIVEEYLEPASSDEVVPHDYKVHCFNGTPELIQVDRGRLSGHRRDLYSAGGIQFAAEWMYPRSDGPQMAIDEHTVDSLVRTATQVAEGIDYVRVDLYHEHDRTIVGEISWYPDAGGGLFVPGEFGFELSRKWTMFINNQSTPAFWNEGL